MKPQQLKEKINSGEDIMLIDVRERDEYEKNEKIAGAQNIPMGQVFIEAAAEKLPKDKKIITICKSGGRCEIVAQELSKKGYDIEYLEGGVNAWNAQ